VILIENLYTPLHNNATASYVVYRFQII